MVKQGIAKSDPMENVMEIKLVKWSDGLKDGLIRVCNNTDRTYLTGRLPYPYTAKDADAWLAMIAEREGRDSLFRAVLADGIVAGNITIEGKRDIYCKDVELGYIFDKDFCGKGIATEATRLMVKEAFEKLDVVKISSEVFAPNVASCRVLEKNGFELEGILRKGAYKNGTLYDLRRYGKLRE